MSTLLTTPIRSQESSPARTASSPRFRRMLRFAIPAALTALSWLHIYLVSIFSNANLLNLSASDHLINAEELIRWDAGHYLWIAETGYERSPCDDADLGNFCGNTAWMPLYSMLARIVALTGIPYEIAGLLVSAIALFGCFYLVWQLLDERITLQNFLLLAMLAVFPGSIYFHAWFPMSMAVLGALLATRGIQRQQWWLAGLGACIAAASHSAGSVIVIALLLSPLFAWQNRPVWRRVTDGFGAAALGALGFFGAIWLMWRATGSWTIYWDTQEVLFDAGLHNPFPTLMEILREGVILGPTPEFTHLQTEAIASPRYTMIAVIGFVVLACAASAHRWLRGWRDQHTGNTWIRIVHSLSGVDWFLLACAIGMFFIPLIAGPKVSYYRTYLMLVPCVYLLRDVFRTLQISVVLVLGSVSVLLSAAFFTGWLV